MKSSGISVVTAGAGTGKTYRLTEELVNLLSSYEESVRSEASGRKVRPEGVLATTFTRRAAANLRERAEGRLAERGYVDAALVLGGATIGTVNAVCGALLSRYSYEIGVSPGLEVIAEEDGTVLFNRALSRILTPDRVERLGSLARRLGYDKKDRFGNLRDWREDVRSIIALARQNTISPEELPRHAERSTQSLLSFYDTPADENGEALTATLYRELLRLQKERHHFAGTKKAEKVIRTVDDAVAGYREGGFATWDVWRELSNADPDKNTRELVRPLVEAASRYPAHPDLHKDIRDFIHEIYAVAAQAMTTYQEYKSARGLIDFVDQEAMFLDALRLPRVRERLREDFDVLLVDEFQDTSPVQLAIFLALSELLPHSVWVGDPKQSVFQFRGADPALMSHALAALGSSARGGVLRTSYRSRPSLVAYTNAFFTRAFAGAHPAEEVELQANRQEVAECGSPVSLWRFRPAEGGKDNVNLHVDAVADALVDALEEGRIIVEGDEGPRPAQRGDVAVLCDTNPRAAAVAERLAVRGVECALNRAGLTSSPEGILVLAALRYLSDPGDTLAQAELIMLTSESPEAASVVKERIDSVADGRDWRSDHGVFRALDALGEQIPGLPVSGVVDRLVSLLQLDHVVGRFPAGQRRRANLEALRGRARSYEDSTARLGGSPTIGGFALRLEDLGKEGTDEQAAGRGDEAVNVLTYHRSKGLEWPVVVALDLDRNARVSTYGPQVVDDRERIDIQEPLAERWIRLWLHPFGRAHAGVPPHERIEASEAWARASDAARAEARRLLYVGFTRARDRLILCVREKKGSLSADWISDCIGSPDPRNVLPNPEGASGLPNPGGASGVDGGTDGGGRVEVEERSFAMAPDADAAPEQAASPASGRDTVRVMPPGPGPVAHLPYRIVPSDVGGAPGDQAGSRDAVVARVIEYGSGFRIPGSLDRTHLGDALHAVFAYYLQQTPRQQPRPEQPRPEQPRPEQSRPERRDRQEPVAEEVGAYVQSILESRGIEDVTTGPDAVAAGIRQLVATVHGIWTVRKLETEVPILLKGEGRLINGVADVLLTTSTGLVLVDHKIMGGGLDIPSEGALDYAGQLMTYARVLERTSGTSMDSCWINMAGQGRLVEVRW